MFQESWNLRNPTVKKRKKLKSVEFFLNILRLFSEAGATDIVFFLKADSFIWKPKTKILL